MEVDPDTKAVPHAQAIFIGGLVLLLFSSILLYNWLNLFFTTAIAETGNICWGTGCAEAEWQAALSRALSQAFLSSNATYKSYLLIFHISLIVFLVRAGQKKDPLLPLEFGMLNLFWMLIGAAVFIAIYSSYKAATPLPQYPIIVPLATGEGIPQSTPGAGPTSLPDGPYLVITGPPAPPAGGCVIGDNTGWSIFPPGDKRCIIGSQLPGWVYGKQLAWSGLLAAGLLTIGLSISQITGWLNRWLRPRSKKTRLGLLFTTFSLVVVCLLAEFWVFGFYLFR